MTELVQHIVDALSLGSIYALVALGIALIFGIMRLINFAYGELIMISGYVMLALKGSPWILVVAATLASAAVAALILERFAFRPVRGASGATMMITSFAVSFLLQNLAILFFGAETKAVGFAPGISDAIDIGGIRLARIDLVTIATTLVLLIALAWYLGRTLTGRQMKAAAEDFTMARLVGIKADRVIASAFALSGLLAAAAAILLTANSGTVSPTVGITPLLTGVVATVIGGMGSLLGAVAGGYLLGAVSVALQVVLPGGLVPYREAFVFGVVIVVLLARPGGVFGRQEEARV